MFRDRVDAGKKLAEALDKYRDRGALVLAIPKGGIEIGSHIAQRLNAQLSIVVSRKLPYPEMPEAGFGAVAEDGSIYIMQDAALWISNGVIERIVQEQREEIERRIKMLRMDEPLPNIESKTVILVDDGIAMGSTMRVTIMLCKKRNAKKIVIAVPVAGESVARVIEAMVDEAIVLEKPWNFRAVAQVYQNWYDVSDEEAIKILYSAKG
jgi:predicted phosphoribosyltransferase